VTVNDPDARVTFDRKVHALEGLRIHDYYERKKAAGKAPMGAMRCVKRQLSDLVYQ
jgi:hypothetical protein